MPGKLGSQLFMAASRVQESAAVLTLRLLRKFLPSNFSLTKNREAPIRQVVVQCRDKSLVDQYLFGIGTELEADSPRGSWASPAAPDPAQRSSHRPGRPVPSRRREETQSATNAASRIAHRSSQQDSAHYIKRRPQG